MATNADIIRNNQKNVEYIVESSRLSFLFSTNNFTTELPIPSVATDFTIEAKFLKLPINAIPEAPRNIDIILDEITPKTKLIATDMEFSDSTFSSVFCLMNFNL